MWPTVIVVISNNMMKMELVSRAIM
jgi:hypothetical protein